MLVYISGQSSTKLKSAVFEIFADVQTDFQTLDCV